MACFADINVSQGSVATYARCSGILNIRLTANLLRNLPVVFFKNRLTFDGIMVTSLWPTLCDWLIVVTIASKEVRTLRQMYQFNVDELGNYIAKRLHRLQMQ